MGLCIWALLENVEGGSLTRDFERQMEAYMPTVLNEVYLITLSVAELQ
jgi:hypothetical protein